jgi:GAF domain-containing protein
MSNTEARAEGARLAEEQAALRRVATAVATASAPVQIFAVVAEEVARLLDVEDAKIYRYEDDATATIVADWGTPDFIIAVGTRLALRGVNVASEVFRTGRPARLDDYSKATGPIGLRMRKLDVRVAVASPIVVDGRLWGCIVAATRKARPLPASASSPSSSRPRSRISRRGRSSRRRARGSWRRPTTSAGAWCVICTMVRNSASCIPSSR